MSAYTVEEVMDDAAGHLGDPNQEQFDHPTLFPYFCNAWRDLVRLMRRWKLPDIERDLYVMVNPYVNRMKPSSFVTDFNYPTEIWERGTPISVAVTSATDAAPVVVTTTTPHGRNTNDVVELQGVDPTLDGPWYITVLSPTTLSLNGSLGPGNGTMMPTAGTMLFSVENWSRVYQRNVIGMSGQSTGNALVTYSQENGYLFFPGAVNPREIRIHYASSGDPPSSGDLGFDDARDVLSHATAAYAAPSQELFTLADRERAVAYGQTGQPDGKGGMIRDLLLPLLTQKQWTQKRPMPFRPRQVDPARAIIL